MDLTETAMPGIGRPSLSSPYLVLAICLAIMLLDGYDTAVAAFAAPVLAKAWHVAPTEMGLMLTGALVGVAFGALIAGPLADRFGRRRVLIVAVIWFGLFTLASASATTIEFLAWARLATGLGLGAAMPNAATLTSETAPPHRRTTFVALLFCGYTLGAASGGVLSGFLIPAYGWQSVFHIGGILPLLLAAVMYFHLRESHSFLATQGKGNVPSSPLAELFSEDRWLHSLLLWATYFLGLLLIFLLRSWLPTLVTMAGMNLRSAAFLSALFDIGGTLGAFAIGWLIDKRGSDIFVTICYLLTGAAALLLSQAMGSVILLGVGIFSIGFLVSGAQSSVPALAARYYPTSCRATGVAWVLGIGRFGGIAGAMFGGQLVELGWSLNAIFASLAVPAVLAALVALIHIGGGRRSKGAAAASGER